MLILALIALGLAGIGLLAASVYGVIELIWYIQARMVFSRLWDEAHTEHALYERLNKLLYLKPKPNYRHNIHCPSCGRFAKRVWGMDTVVECHVHAVQFREWDVAVDWATVPLAPGVTLVTDPIILKPSVIEPELELEELEEVEQVYRELELAPEVSYPTGAIPIILPAKEFAAIGT